MLSVQRLFTHQLLAAAAMAAFTLLSACAKPAQPITTESPAALVTPSGENVTTLQSPDLDSPLGPDELTREAALDNSGKSGPTLPPGDLPQQLELPKTTATPASPGAQADSGSVAMPDQATPGDSQATLNPEQLATRDAALDNSGKSGPTPQADTGPRASNCLSGAGLISLPLAALVIHRRKRKT